MLVRETLVVAWWPGLASKRAQCVVAWWPGPERGRARCVVAAWHGRRASASRPCVARVYHDAVMEDAAQWSEGSCPCCLTQGRFLRRELGFCRWARNCQRFLSNEYARSCSLLLVGGSLPSISPIYS